MGENVLLIRVKMTQFIVVHRDKSSPQKRPRRPRGE